jgi:alanine dehydrogenase
MTLQMMAIESGLHPVRTGAGGAAVVQALSRPGSAMALIGSGRIARATALAVLATCQPSSLRIFSPTRSHRERLSQELAGSTTIPVTPCASMEEAVGDAEVVLSATEADPPAIDFSSVNAGSLVVSLGLNELTAETVLGGQLLATGLEEILSDERQVEPFRTLYSFDPPRMEAIDFCDLLARDLVGWDRSRTTWVFALGTAVWDLAFMRWLYERALAAGRGTLLAP